MEVKTLLIREFESETRGVIGGVGEGENLRTQ